MSCRAWAPIGGRPTRRIARSCSSDASGRSEKSIARRTAVGRSFFAARPPRADDADRFAIVCLPLRIGHDQDAVKHRASDLEKPSFFCGVPDVRAIERDGISEYRRGFIECDAMLDEICRSLLPVPLEHLFSIYRTRARTQNADNCAGGTATSGVLGPSSETCKKRHESADVGSRIGYDIAVMCWRRSTSPRIDS